MQTTDQAPLQKLIRHLTFPLLAATLLMGNPKAANAQTVLFNDGDFNDFPTGWVISAPSGTSIVTLDEAPPGSGNTRSLHLKDDSATEVASAAVSFSEAYTGSEGLTIVYDFRALNVMDGNNQSLYSSGLFRVLTGSGTRVLALQASKPPGGSASALQTWGTGNGNAQENVLITPGEWYRVTITLPGTGLEQGRYTVSLDGLDGAPIHSYTTPYPRIDSFSFTGTLSNIPDYAQLVFSSDYGVAPVADIRYTNINATVVPEPSAMISLSLFTLGAGWYLKRARIR